MEYPEEIYRTLAGGLLTESQRSRAVAMWPRRHAYEVGYGKGMTRGMISQLSQPDPLAGYSNLTAAISAGEPIDWERLDGKRVQCVNPEVRGEMHGTLKQNGSLEPYLPGAWWDGFSNAAYINALYDGWYGNDGWTLYVEGEIPLHRKTADQLEVGHFFTGVLSGTTSESLMCVVGEPGNGKHVRYATDFMPSHHPASKWEVIEEHGPFQKPEGK